MRREKSSHGVEKTSNGRTGQLFGLKSRFGREPAILGDGKVIEMASKTVENTALLGFGSGSFSSIYSVGIE
jgi:hypothetical protein